MIGVRTIAISGVETNVPPADKRFCEFVFINDSLEVIGVSLGVIILSFERLITLTLSARVITDLMKRDRCVNDRETNHVTGTDEIKALEEFGIVELFLKRQSGARETGDKDDRWSGRVTGSMGPDPSTILGPHEPSERGHDEEIQALVTRGKLIGRRAERRDDKWGHVHGGGDLIGVQSARERVYPLVIIAPRL